MKTKIKVDILAKSNIASLMQYEKKPVNGPSKLLASMLTHFLTASGPKMPLRFALSTSLIYIWKKSCSYSPERNPGR